MLEELASSFEATDPWFQPDPVPLAWTETPTANSTPVSYLSDALVTGQE